MIPEKSAYETRSTLPGEAIAMGIDVDAMSHIMSMLVNQYSDPRLACIREYATNALDSHIEAGQPRPIEVTLPGPLSPFLRVRDFGVGMSADDIRTIYSRYGASTKRGSNDAAGKFGIGGKAALAYTEQFTLVGVKGGRRVQVAIGRTSAGGTMTVVTDAATTDPNGVEIVIPVKSHDTHRFDQTARSFFRFWTPGTVLVNGEEPEHITGLALSDTLTIIEDSQSFVVMGQTAYPANVEHGLSYGNAIVARVAIGDVDITPSRESLNYESDRTKTTLKRVRHEFEAAVTTAVQKEVDAQATHHEAVAAWLKWNQVVPRHAAQSIPPTYRGEPIPRSLVLPKRGQDEHGLDIPTQVFSVSRTRQPLNRHTKMNHVAVEYFNTALWLTNYDTTKAFTATKRKKLNQWCVDANIPPHLDVRQFILTPTVPADFKWIDPERVFQWDDVAAIKLVYDRNGVGRSGRIPGSFDCWIDGAYTTGHPAAEIDQDEDVFYAEGGKWAGAPYADLLTQAHPGCYVVNVPANRLAKFRRDFPKARACHAAVEAAYVAWKTRQTTDVLTAAAIADQHRVDAFRALDPKRVTDPDLKRAIELLAVDTTKHIEERRAFWNVLGGPSIAERTRECARLKWTDPLANYPLFNVHTFRVHPNEMYLYLNASHAARTGRAC